MLNNPVDNQILGPVGRAEMLRDSLRTLDYDPDAILPSKDEMMGQIKAPPITIARLRNSPDPRGF